MSNTSIKKDGGGKQAFALEKQNYMIIAVGFVLIVLGYILMSGGAAASPDDWNYDEIFSSVRISVAPTTSLIGFLIVLYGIMKKPQNA
ncbi:MAG: DUF3098 domain-containing protein [Flavobacteriales bacterium]|nr:DUF3098 domain-containing protein [Flavobacteriales bacterium]